MITQMEVFTPRVISSPLPGSIGTEATDPIQIINIDGLGPVIATVNTVRYGYIDGEFYNGSVVGKRNIVIKVRLNPDWSSQTIEGLRAYLYQYFMPKQQINLRFTSTHMAQVEITGRVETMDPNLFSNDPEYQISVVCPQPAFVAVAPTTRTGVVQDVANNALPSLVYEGTVPTGFLLEVNPAPSFVANSQIRIFNRQVDTQQFIVTVPAMDSSRTFQLNSNQGNKRVRNIQDSDQSFVNLLGKTVSGSVWPLFQPGTNSFRVQLNGSNGQPWTLTYKALYGGL